jgi:hypothetical protein
VTTQPAQPPTSTSDTRKVSGRVTLFGHEPSLATVEVAARGRRWRLTRAGALLVAALLLAPVAALIPPHAPWAIAILGAGFVFARRRWNEHFSLISLQAECPRCGADLSTTRGGRLRAPHPVTCDECHREMRLEADPR